MHAKKNIKKLKAITLIELSIVLAVMGLLISATLIGTEIIKQAQIRSIITHIQDAEKAIYQFVIAHEYLPGDLPNATTLWGYKNFREKCSGYDTGTAIEDFEDADNKRGFDGNGDGLVSLTKNNATTNSVGGADVLGVMCHLAVGRFIKPGNTVITRVPSSVTAQFRKAGMSPDGKNSIYLIGSDTDQNKLLKGHALYMIGSKPNSVPRAPDPVNANITSRDLMAIDIKIDDGMPGTGKVVMFVESNEIGDLKACCIKSAAAATTGTGTGTGTATGAGTVAGITGSSKKCDLQSTYSPSSTGKNACYMSYQSKMF